mmetsp:Transcript_99216/g.308682  ORF Transcript_99216/g.308682 Transcript_99216/m.308682 type:complete len:300 (+) Transcript_99216:522-1421(+)
MCLVCKYSTTLEKLKKWSTSILEYSSQTSGCRFKKRPWRSQMCQPQIRRGTGITGRKHIWMASQFVTMPRKKPVRGNSTIRAVPCISLHATSCTQPQTKPKAAPHRSMKRNSRAPMERKKWFSSALLSWKTETIMPSLSMPISSSQSRSMNSRQISGQVSWMLSKDASTSSSCTAAGSCLSQRSGKWRRPTVLSAPPTSAARCGRTLATRILGSTLSSQWRGPNRYGRAHLKAVWAIFTAFRGTTPCQPIPMPVSPCCHKPKNLRGRNIIWIASQMWNHVKNKATMGIEANSACCLTCL